LFATRGKRGRTTAQQRQAMQQSARNTTGANSERAALDLPCQATKWKLFIKVKCLSESPWPGRVILRITTLAGLCPADGDRAITVNAQASGKIHILGRRHCQLKIEALPSDEIWQSVGAKTVALPAADKSLVEVEIKAKEVVPEIEIRWADDNSAAPDMLVAILESGADKRNTDRTAWAKWAQGIRCASYGVDAVSADGDHYVLFRDDAATKSVDLTKGPKHSFKIKRYPVSFRVQKQVAGAVEELVGARVKIKAPDLEKATELSEAKAIAKFVIPVIQEDQKATVEVVSLAPDDTDAVFEVIEVVPE
jgi:hypothetical protein